MKHEFVEFVPDVLSDDVLYVSIGFATVVHKCACGCGSEVVTPLSPVDWKLIFDGKTISLHPSIGNWSFPCQSHYWIERDQVRWSRKWSDQQVAAGRESDRKLKEYVYVASSAHMDSSQPSPSEKAGREEPSHHDAWQRLRSWWSALWE
jgi:hypothetical protein